MLWGGQVIQENMHTAILNQLVMIQGEGILKAVKNYFPKDLGQEW